jgi:hypothetical protein
MPAEARAEFRPVSYFFRKCSVILICLQSLKIHKYFSVHANGVIQISLDSLIEYLSGGIGLTSVGAM